MFIHPFINRHRLLLPLAVVNNTAAKTHKQIHLSDSALNSFGYTTRSGIDGSTYNILRNHNTFSTAATTLYIACIEFPIVPFLQPPLFSVLFNSNNLNDCEGGILQF
jgi:hypothetical protein